MARVRRHTSGGERGSSMLIATGLVALITVGTLMSLTVINSEAAVVSNSRREREAFFAAQAGMAEAKEKVGALLGQDPFYGSATTGAIGALMTEFASTPATGLGDPINDPWLDVLCNPGGNCAAGNSADRWVRYSFTRTSAGGTSTAIDDGVTTANTEMRDPNGNAFQDFPANTQVFYRVFLRDDGDDAFPFVDANKKVWLVAVGEVRPGDGSRPVRAVMRALVTSNNNSSLINTECFQANGCPTKTSGNTMDDGTPDVTKGASI